MCGGTSRPAGSRSGSRGLSPRVRGNRLALPHDAFRLGSIPACAGEPEYPRPDRSGNRVYPRVCGGTVAPTAPTPSAIGLSPRVRGNPKRVRHVSTDGRSIPACAGEPTAFHPPPGNGKVYPRVCGGTIRAVIMEEFNDGLSPRVRGNLKTKYEELDWKRSIPACAGEPAVQPVAGLVVEVYPRVCGGTVAAVPYESLEGGLSPRVRGNLRHWKSRKNWTGSIPACAGEPLRLSLRLSR